MVAQTNIEYDELILILERRLEILDAQACRFGECYYYSNRDGFEIGLKIFKRNPTISLKELEEKRGRFYDEYGNTTHGVGFNDGMRNANRSIKTFREQRGIAESVQIL